MWAMLTGRTSDADRVLDALVKWRTASGGSPELFDRATRDYGSSLPPHATAAAAIVTLIRNALVFDDDDSLWLTMGARVQWWRHGRVHKASTRWGDVDLSFYLKDHRASWEWTPVSVPTILTVPIGFHIDHLDPATGRQLSQRRIAVPAGTRHFSVELAPSDSE
jgi:hypothetical protein